VNTRKELLKDWPGGLDYRIELREAPYTPASLLFCQASPSSDPLIRFSSEVNHARCI